ncbi:MAG: type IX secretion system membrane protein PorP/SprF [Bacteroidota bacterium]
MFKKALFSLSALIFFTIGLTAQEESPFVTYDVPSQNLLKFNRFLINPTFSTVREDKSYINLFHRNQSVSFDDNNQTYFLSYSGRIGDRSGVGLSLYTQREGLIDNFGLLANFAYGIKLSEKSNFTFGANFSYYNSGFNQDRANPQDDDPFLNSLDSSTLISFQPGFNISYGKFDFGLFAENLFDYNLKTSESVTEFDEKTYSGHLQYTHQFENAGGIFEQGRVMPLARVRSVGNDDVVLGGNLIMDLPKIGWLQAGYDDFYGASAGLGFHLNKRLSLGYTIEKGLSDNFENFGANHEISLAYSFTPHLTEDRVMLEKEYEEVVSVDEEVPVEELSLTEKDLKIAELEKKLAENDAILDELLFRQDSIEKNRDKDLERRFENVMRLVRRETKGQRPELEQQAKNLYFENTDDADTGNNITQAPLSNHGLTNTTASKKVIQLKNVNAPVASSNTTTAIKPVAKDKISSKHRKQRFKSFAISDVESGHYLIANVYKGTKYMNLFIEKLRTQGHEADYFTNPKNGLNYVYLKGFKDKVEAVEAYKSNLDGTYQGATWVMQVKGSYDNTLYADKASPSSKYDDSTLQQNVVAEGNENGQSEQMTYETHHLEGIGSGFYIIANVFEKPKNATRFVRELNAKGLNATYFINPENNYRYVYLKKHDDWNNALVSYYTKLNNAYGEKMWIMRVKPNV